MRISALIAGVLAVGLAGCAPTGDGWGRQREACVVVSSAIADAELTQYGMLANPARSKAEIKKLAELAGEYKDALPQTAAALAALHDAFPLNPASMTEMEIALFEAAAADLSRAGSETDRACN